MCRHHDVCVECFRRWTGVSGRHATRFVFEWSAENFFLSFFRSHLISSHLISSRLVSSRLVSSRLVSSRLISSHLISSHLISSRLNLVSYRLVSYIPSYHIPPHLILSYPANPIPSHPIPMTHSFTRIGDIIIEIESANVEDDDKDIIVETLRNACLTVRLVFLQTKRKQWLLMDFELVDVFVPFRFADLLLCIKMPFDAWDW